MKKGAIVAFIYGLLLVLGGIMGYVKAGSAVSLGLGIIFGGLLFSGFGMWKKCIVSYGWALGLTVALAILFAYRFYATGKWMPAGTMLIVSIVVAFLLLLWNPRKGQ